jgi:hypothetical protein
MIQTITREIPILAISEEYAREKFNSMTNKEKFEEYKIIDNIEEDIKYELLERVDFEDDWIRSLNNLEI